MKLQTITIIPKELNIYKRSSDAPYQARIRLSGGNWHRVTTGERVLENAKDKAMELYYEIRMNKKNNLPPVSRKCSSIAKATIAHMQRDLETGVGKKVYNDYINFINRFFIPFFGRRSISSIGQKLLIEFDEFRAEKLGKYPSASTLNTHNSAMNKVFQVALDNNFVVKSQLPILRNNGKKNSVRPSFTISEYRIIVRRLRDWSKTGHTNKTRMIRELLRDYVLILANTGMRHGTESLSLKWKHIEWFENDKREKFLQITVDGKTGNRQLIARHSVINHLMRIKSHFEDLDDMSLDEILKARLNEYVFRTRDGQRTNQLDRAFNQFLKQNDMLFGSTSDTGRSLYSLRHFYATIQLQRGRNIHHLARQMGTSVKMLEKHYSKLTPMLVANEFASIY